MLENILSNIDAIVFSAGEVPSKKHLEPLLAFKGLTICADSSLSYALAYGFTIDYAIGDFDSLSNKALLKEVKKEILTYSIDKEFTDTYLACQLAYQKGSLNVLLIGGAGERIDHFMDNWELWKMDFSLKYWITKYELMILLDRNITIPSKVGETLSFCAIEKPLNLESSNLKWPINSNYWQNHNQSTSNIALGLIDITINKGKAVLSIPYNV